MIKKTNSTLSSPIWLFVFWGMGLFLASCNTTKFLEKNQSLVKKNEIVFEGEVEGESTLEYELSTIIKQKKNRVMLGFVPSEWFYYNHSDPRDTTRWDDLIKRWFAEPPSIYEETEADATAKNMTNFLQKRGYFDAKVSHESKIKSQKTSVTYRIFLGERYYFDKVKYIAEDPIIQVVLDSLSNNSVLKEGAPVDERLYDQESNRIRFTLLNKGYFDYNKAYLLPLKGKKKGNKVDAELKLVKPKGLERYEIQRIGKILVYPRYNPLDLSSYSVDTIIGGVHFITSGELDVKAQVLLNAIYLKEGAVLRQKDLDKTRAQLSRLGIYKFVGIKSIKDKKNPNTINIQIQLPPKNKMRVDQEFELITAQNNAQRNSSLSLGMQVSADFRNRNALRGAELFRSSLAFGIESPLDTLAITSLNFNGRIDLFTPKFVDFVGVLGLMKRAKFIKERFYKDLSENARTQFSLSYNYIQIQNFQNYNSVELNLFGYDVKLPNNRQFVFTPTGVNFLNIEVQPAFEDILASNEFLRLSTTDQLFTGLFFRNLSYTQSRSNKLNTFRQDYRIFLETSGLEAYALNQIFSPDEAWKAINPFAHYFRTELETRFTWQLGRGQAFATRANIGVATSFGRFSQAVPYVKQFFVGGPSSIRAWDIRELGPGSYLAPPITDNFAQPFFQTGDFKLEFNAEYRFDLFWFLEGALFVDAGNIWSWKDLDRPGSQLTWNFIDQIAVGAGTGARLDFSYFIIRLDVGWKVHYPYSNNGQRWVAFQSPNYNLAIGYPF